MSGAHDVVWVSVKSHRARAALRAAVPGLGQQWGTWPSSGGWPKGEFYQVPARLSDRLAGIKGLAILKGAPRGNLFKRVTGL